MWDVNVIGGWVGWRHDGSGFWYALCADPAGFQKQLWFRELGDPGDRLDLAGPFADERIAEHRLSASPDGHWVMDRVQRGDSGEWQVFLRGHGASGSWRLVGGGSRNCLRAALRPHTPFPASPPGVPPGPALPP